MKNNLKELLKHLGFTEDNNIFSKNFPSNNDACLSVDFTKEEIIYPEDKGLIINERQTCNLKSPENFVVFECVHRLLEKGYNPKHIELEPKWKVGHGASGGRADILIKDNKGKAKIIIECKTAGKEFKKAWGDTLRNGGQLFTYQRQETTTKHLILYASDFIDNELVRDYYLINIIDPKEFLERKDKQNLKLYKDATDVEILYKVWKETYQNDFYTIGAFEDDIEPYKLGKKKYIAKDLKTINHTDIQKKYHEFATILRQHNVSGRENAFDKLLNLFLCKVVDEMSNGQKGLEFFWKGTAYDDHKGLQDRLQKLYKDGMERFLGEDVTYISKKMVKEAFRFVKEKPDATRDTIEEYIDKLKFFTNNDFAFIDVHNEKLFYQNAEVLLKIVRMLQDIKIITEEHNQFLGDMFEGFLDQGVKQSEGQFFTPLPIVKFISRSLPIDNILEKEQKTLPKMIDYACGSGHFLNEYASLVKQNFPNKKPHQLAEYYKNTIGIEKEYRLSKVAKVSAFMYGQNDISIIYNDALKKNKNIKENSFDVLMANPPYSVKGFLETLEEEDRKVFELMNSIDKIDTNNSIETFFIERSCHLLKDGGVAGIIVPSSILNERRP